MSIIQENTKVCTKCRRIQSISVFGRNRRSSDGYTYQCKDCRKEYLDKTRDRVNKRKSVRRANKKERLRTMLLQNPKQCQCGCGEFLVDTSRYLPYHHNRIYKREKHPNWKGGRGKTIQGYVRINRPDHPRANEGRVLEHIVKYEEYHKCCILPWGTIHHRNGIKDDNSRENLVLKSSSRHTRDHGLEKREALARARNIRCPYCKLPSVIKAGFSGDRQLLRCHDCSRCWYADIGGPIRPSQSRRRKDSRLGFKCPRCQLPYIVRAGMRGNKVRLKCSVCDKQILISKFIVDCILFRINKGVAGFQLRQEEIMPLLAQTSSKKWCHYYY